MKQVRSFSLDSTMHIYLSKSKGENDMLVLSVHRHGDPIHQCGVAPDITDEQVYKIVHEDLTKKEAQYRNARLHLEDYKAVFDRPKPPEKRFLVLIGNKDKKTYLQFEALEDVKLGDYEREHKEGWMNQFDTSGLLWINDASNLKDTEFCDAIISGFGNMASHYRCNCFVLYELSLHTTMRCMEDSLIKMGLKHELDHSMTRGDIRDFTFRVFDR